MRRTSSIGLAVLLMALTLAFARPSQADTVFDVTGTVAMTGNNSCGGPCIETVNFSFELIYSFVPVFDYYQAASVPAPLVFSGSGPLFTATTTTLLTVQNPFPSNILTGPIPGISNENYIPMLGSNGFELDLFVGVNQQPAIEPPTFGSYLYACGQPSCTADGFAYFIGSGNFIEEPVTYTVQQVPEPGMFALLGAAGLLWFLILTFSRRQ